MLTNIKDRDPHVDQSPWLTNMSELLLVKLLAIHTVLMDSRHWSVGGI